MSYGFMLLDLNHCIISNLVDIENLVENVYIM